MGEYHQPVASSSKSDKSTKYFRFSLASRNFLKDYFDNTSKFPHKKEREQILAHLKGLGETEVTAVRISGWFSSNRQRQKPRSSLPLPTSAPDQTETKWVDANHETLWPSLTRETLKDLQDLYTELTAENPNAQIPCEPWAKILDAKPVHVRMWCKAMGRKPRRQSRQDIAPTVEPPSQLTEEHSQLPTPGNSISPEPPTPFVAWPPSPLDGVKNEPPASPVVDTTPFLSPPEATKENTSLGLHEAIESAFGSLCPPPPPATQPLKPPSTATPDRQRKPLSINSHRTHQVVSPPTSPLIPATSDAPGLASASLPSASTALPFQFEHSPHSPHRESSAPPAPEEPTPGQSGGPDCDLARERAKLATGVAEKLDELNGKLDSARELAQFAGSIQSISQRNKQFLKDVSAGRFTHLRLTSAHLPDRQARCSMLEYNPLRVLAEWRDGKGKQRDRDDEVQMAVD